MKEIFKRNGSRQKYNSNKIVDAVTAAFEATNTPYDSKVLELVESQIIKIETPETEQIQNFIEKALYELGYFETMKAFMLYRHNKLLERETKVKKTKPTTFLNCTSTIEEYISKEDWRINANSNTGYSNAALINQTAGKVIANFWLDKVLSSEEGKAHREGDIHIHDLDCLTGYCAGWSLRVLLDEGFNGVRGRVSCAAPNHLGSALGQMVNFLGILQGEWAGAQAFSSFDTYLAPYLFKDKLTDEELEREIESFIYNLNVPARWGQSPFTNITLDITVPKDLGKQIPTRNQKHLFKGLNDSELLEECKKRGKENLIDMTYADFQPEMERIVVAYYKIMTKGDAQGQPFTFPIPTVNITEDFNWNSKSATAIFKNAAKMGSSYFQNFIGSQYIKDENGNKIENPLAYKPDAVRSMCCRLQLDLRELLKRGNGLFGSAESTGSVSVVTLNLARLGYLYKGNKVELYAQLDRLLDIAKSINEKRRKYVQEMYDRGLYPYTKRYLPGFANHFSTIGVNGANEMIRNFTNDKEDISTQYGKDFAIELNTYIREKLKKYQEETGNLYNLEATPAEGTTYRFAKEDKKRFHDIIQAGSGDNIYYTNSTQLPASFTDDLFEALDLQDELQQQYTGGTVLHLYMKEKISSTEACKNLVKKVLTNYGLPYITITPVFSVCEKHGYIPGDHEYCPKCDEELIHKYSQDS